MYDPLLDLSVFIAVVVSALQFSAETQSPIGPVRIPRLGFGRLEMLEIAYIRKPMRSR